MAPPAATGIDYLALTASTHHQQLQADERIGYHALYGTAPDGPEQIPGQLCITDIDPTIIGDEGEVSA